VSLLGLLLVAVGVSADAFAVALGKGLHMKTFDLRHALAIAVAFGAFQAVMPLLGWVLASQFARYITGVDHWVAFGLLCLIGIKMIVDAVRGGEDEAEDSDALDVRELLVLAVATSIDALAVGISFAFLPVPIGQAAGLIGVCTLVLSLAGVLLGRRVGARYGAPAEIAGGVILILIGTRVVLDHTGVL
jgi:putative Mn2+ efflux pump MntP